jgi:hypothetical protein
MSSGDGTNRKASTATPLEVLPLQSLELGRQHYDHLPDFFALASSWRTAAIVAAD